MKKVIWLLLAVSLVGCEKNISTAKLDKDDPIQLGACTLYTVYVDGYRVIASPNCHVSK